LRIGNRFEYCFVFILVRTRTINRKKLGFMLCNEHATIIIAWDAHGEKRKGARMRRKISSLLLILILASLVSACTGIAQAQETTPVSSSGSNQKVTRTLSVSGSGKAYLTPDTAYVNIGVHTEGKNAAEAVAANNSHSQKVIDALKNQGVAEKDIQTTNFSIYPQQQYDTQGKPTGEIIYLVDNSVIVTVRDIDKVGKVLDAAVQAGANSINSVEFEVADKIKALSDARKAAVLDAQTKAEELANAAGVELGEVQTITESSGGSAVPVYRAGAPAPMAIEAASVPIQPGQMVLTVDVSIVYEIR